MMIQMTLPVTRQIPPNDVTNARTASQERPPNDLIVIAPVVPPCCADVRM